MRCAPACLAAVIVLAVIPAMVTAPVHGAVQRPFPTVAVTGEGIATAIPDLAHATAGITTEAKTPREAADANARLMTAVVAAARQAGIAEKDIRTARFSIFPVQGTRGREGVPQTVGYRAANQVQVTIRDAAKVGEVLDQLIAAGATNIAGVEFAISEPGKLLDEARAAAFAEAKRKAELYARAAGAQVGRAVSIAEQEADAGGPVVMRGARAAAAPTTPVAPGETTLRVQVTVTFELLQ